MGIQINGNTDIISAADGSLDISGFRFENKTTAQRNAGVSTATGAAIYNTTTNQLEVYTPQGWVVGAQERLNATGGILDTTSRSGYNVHTFTSPGTFTVSGAPGNVEYLVIAGGGGSCEYIAGGGGAGGYRTSTSFPMTPGPYPVTVGGGGAGFSAPNRGGTGTDSTFSTITSSVVEEVVVVSHLVVLEVVLEVPVVVEGVKDCLVCKLQEQETLVVIHHQKETMVVLVQAQAVLMDMVPAAVVAELVELVELLLVVMLGLAEMGKHLLLREQQ